VPGESGPDTTVVTMADNGTTLHLPVGRRFSLSLDGGVVWTLKGSDESVVRQVQASLPSGGQGTYETVAPGTSTLGGSGKPHCSGDGACPMFLLEFRVTIVVS
jgi:predicted secreted protein